MQLRLTWPEKAQTLNLDEHYSSDAPAIFDPCIGEFSNGSPLIEQNVILFYWTAVGPIIFNACREYVCLIDNTFLHCGKSHSLHFASEIQLGNFKIEVAMDDESESPTYELHNLLASANMDNGDYGLSEVEDILPHGGYHEADIQYLHEEVLVREAGGDILKVLELEYKKFLIWGEQHREVFAHQSDQENKLSLDDSHFDMVREEMKSKTLTECILESSFLIDKVWTELDVVDTDDDILYEDEKHDILKVLAPDTISTRDKKSVPALVFQDLYKIGLDSHF